MGFEAWHFLEARESLGQRRRWHSDGQGGHEGMGPRQMQAVLLVPPLP